MSVLTNSQKKAIALVSHVPSLRDNFWLTGGTALAEFYLQHRYSEDLDFFTADQERFPYHVRDFEIAAAKEGLEIAQTKKPSETFFGVIAKVGEDRVKIDFAVDAPYRHKPTEMSPAYGIRIENTIDIACGKVSALFDRSALRDFVDVYFIHKEIHSLDELIPWAKDRHGGMENYMLAISFQRVREIPEDSPIVPRMIKNLDMTDLRKTFLEYASRLLSEPFDARPWRE